MDAVLYDLPEPEEKWVDVTKDYQKHTSALAPHEMVHEEGFDLSSVMSGAEIGDPKMDSGLGYKEFLTLKEVKDSLLLKEPTDEQVVRLMECLLRKEASWLDGRMLHQSIFTCVYFHERELALGCPALHAYITGVARCVSCVADTIVAADVRELEEFTGVTFGVDCCQDAPLQSIAGELADAAAEVTKKLEKEGGPVLQSLLAFLHYRSQQLRAFKFLDEGEAGRENAVKALQQCREALLKIDKLHKESGRDAEPVKGAFFDDVRHWQASACLISAVEPMTWAEAMAVHMQLVDDHIKACNVWDCTKLLTLTTFLEEYSASRPNPCLLARSRLMLLVWDGTKILGKYDFAELVTEYLDEEFGATIYRRLLADENTVCSLKAQQAADAGERPSKNSPENESLGFSSHREHLVFFIEQLRSVQLRYMHVLCQQRARFRRKLANLFPEWDTLLSAAWDVERCVFDGALATNPKLRPDLAQRALVLHTFVLQQILHCMITFLQLGFELDLYAPGEYRSMVWYLDFLTTMRLENIRFLYKSNELSKEDAALMCGRPMMRPSTRAGGGGRNRGRHALPPILSTRRQVQMPQGLYELYEAEHFMLRGVGRVLNAGQLMGLIPTPDAGEKRTRYCSAANRFAHRVSPFQHLQKPMLARYDQFEQHCGLTPTTTPVEQLGEAKHCFQRSFERAQEKFPDARACTTAALKVLGKVAKFNDISVSVTNRLVGTEQQGRLILDWSQSCTLPIIKFVRDETPKAVASPRAAAAGGGKG